jgi:hypothetical protein
MKTYSLVIASTSGACSMSVIQVFDNYPVLLNKVKETEIAQNVTFVRRWTLKEVGSAG